MELGKYKGSLMNNNLVKIWQWFEDKYHVHCEIKEQRDEAMSWSGSGLGSTYYTEAGREWDVTISKENLNRAKRLVKTKKVEKRPSWGTKTYKSPNVELFPSLAVNYD